MTEVPKIVHGRLRESALRQANQPHPDADLMAAFVEQALSSNERGAILEHLAACVDCRDIVLLALPALALPADEQIPLPAAATFETAEVAISRSGRETPGNGFAWANLLRPNLLWANMRWAALATGVAVAIFGVYVGWEHRGQTNTPIATATPAPTFSKLTGSQPEPAASAATTQLSATTVPESKPPEATSSGATAKVQPSHRSVGHAQPVDPPTSSVTRSDVLASNRSAGGDQTEENSSILGSDASGNDLLAMNQAPSIERAKPAPGESTLANAPAQAAPENVPQTSTSTATTLHQDTAWSISAGVLQRSLDGGRNWQPILAGKGTWLCYGVRGEDVWVAGQGGTLQHSVNGGETWAPIVVTKDGRPLAADVTRIIVRDSGEVVLSTASHETWVTRDSGRTWDKQQQQTGDN